MKPSLTPIKRNLALRKVISTNLRALMAATPELATEKALRAVTKLGGGSIDGARQGNRNTGIDTIDLIARAFGLQAWQLLVPDLDPANIPALRSRNSEMALYRELEKKIQSAVHESVSDYAAKTTDP